MLTRDTITIDQLLHHLPALRFSAARNIKIKVMLLCAEEELKKSHGVTFGQVVNVGQLRFIVIGTDKSDLWLYSKDRKGINNMSSLGSGIEITTEIAPLAEIITAVYASSDIEKYLLVDSKINRYRLEPKGDYARVSSATEIASGGFGVVHVVVKNNETLACKVLKKKYNQYSDELNCLRIVSEATSSDYLATLKYFAIDQDGYEQLFFEYLNMGDLDKYWRNGGDNYSHQSCYRIFHHVICGLNVLHDARIVHRDVKPLNIYLHRDSKQEIHAKLGDFGLALPVHLLKGQGINGSMSYFAPEQWKNIRLPGEEEVQLASDINSNYATDVYAFGISVYETVECKDVDLPLKSTDEFREAVISGEPHKSSITSSDPKVSVKLISIFRRCTEREASIRPTANAVKKEFELGSEVMSDELCKYSP